MSRPGRFDGGLAVVGHHPYLLCSDTAAGCLPARLGFLQVESRDELALMEAVATLGPISVAVDAGGCTANQHAQASTIQLAHHVMPWAMGQRKSQWPCMLPMLHTTLLHSQLCFCLICHCHWGGGT